ncbi:SpaA isopeptide-forming pilin-related protein [Streptomyces sp. NPDC001393]
MRTRMPTAALVVAAAVTGTLACVPTASAHADEPTPATSAVPTGGVQITKKDAGGDLLAGASFTLLDTTGKEVAQGKTDTDGKLAFNGLAAGVYRLKEVSSGNPLLDVVADQDVIVTPGQTVPLTITDPFKPAALTIKTADKTSGKPLTGAVINITPAGSSGDPVTLTTGRDGTATAQLPVSSATGTTYTVTETTAPSGYQLDAKPVKLTAKPGAPVTVTLTDTAKEQPTTPSESPSRTTPGTTAPDKPSVKPTAPATTPWPSTSASSSPLADNASPSSSTAPTPEGTLAHTGADATPWLLGGAGLLLVAGGAAVVAARRRGTRDDVPNDEPDQV